MPEESESVDRAWLLEPLGPSDLRIHVEVGEGAEVTPEIRDALDALTEELQGAEVEGFSVVKCPVLNDCGDFYCVGYFNCDSLSRRPCFWNMDCQIADLTRR